MKKIMNIFVLVAAAAMALVSCQRQEIPETETNTSKSQEYLYRFDISANAKSAIGDNCVVWEEDDKIGVYASTSVNQSGNVTVDPSVSFVVKSTVALTAGDKVYCYYPYATHTDDATAVSMTIPTEQTEQDQMPMVSLPFAVTENLEANTDKPVGEILFANLGSVIEFNVYSTTEEYQTEYIQSVAFNADQAIAGNFTFDLTAVDYSNEETLAISGYKATSVVSSLSTSTKVSADKNAATIVKMVVAPGSYTGNVVVTTDKATYTYPISTAKEFGRSAVKPLGVNLKAENRAENTADDYSGSYAIVAKSGEKFYYLTNVDSGTSTKRLSSKEISSLPAENANLDASVVWNLIAKGDGTYYIQSAENDLYLDHHAKSSNSATLEQTTSSVISMAIEPTNDGRYMISYENETDDGTEIRKLVKNSQDSYFAFYTSEQSGAVYLIPAVAVKIPAIQIETLVLAEAEGGEVSVNYSIKNPTNGKNLTATETSDWLSVTVEESKVTFNIDENNVEEERTATVTLAYEGAESVVVTVTQAAKAAVGVEEVELVIDFTQQGYSNQQEVSSVSKNPINVVFNKGSNSNAPKYYTTGTAVRVYGGSYFIVSSDKTIVKVALTFGSDDGSNAITTDSGAYTNGTWTGNANSVKFSIGGTSGNRRIQKITVTYQKAVGEVILASRDLKFSSSEVSAKMGQAFSAPILSGVTSDVTYTSSNTDVATVDATTGVVTLVAVGTTTITASAPATAEYEAGEVSYNLNVHEASATQEYTYTWTASSGALGTTTNGTVTKTLSNVSWTIQRSGTGYTGWTSNAIQIGKNGGAESMTLKTSGIEGTIKSVSVECSSYQAKHNVSISVGGVSYVSSKATSSWTTVGTVTGEGTASGEIEIKFTAGSGARAMYIKSIKVVYEN